MAVRQLPDLPEEVDNELDKSNSTQLRKRFRRLYAAMQENEKVDLYFDSVEVHYAGGEHRLTSVVIDSHDNWNEKGSFGFDRFHLILGPRGGVNHADKTSVLGGVVDYSDKRRAFGRICGYIREHMS
jgi:hypothetical protein